MRHQLPLRCGCRDLNNYCITVQCGCDCNLKSWYQDIREILGQLNSCHITLLSFKDADRLGVATLCDIISIVCNSFKLAHNMPKLCL